MTITEMEKEIIKAIKVESKIPLASEQGYKDLAKFVRKLFKEYRNDKNWCSYYLCFLCFLFICYGSFCMNKKETEEEIKRLLNMFNIVDKLEQRIATLEKVLASHAKCIGEMREDKDEWT